MRLYDSRYRTRPNRARASSNNLIKKIIGAIIVMCFAGTILYEFTTFSIMLNSNDVIPPELVVLSEEAKIEQQQQQQQQRQQQQQHLEDKVVLNDKTTSLNDITDSKTKDNGDDDDDDDTEKRKEENDDDADDDDDTTDENATTDKNTSNDDDDEDDDGNENSSTTKYSTKIRVPITSDDDVGGDDDDDDDNKSEKKDEENEDTFIDTTELTEWQKYAAKENIGPFQRHEGVAMVTKVLWPNDIPSLKQMICLFNAAYNHRVGYYDIVVFTTMPWTEEQVQDLASVAAPAKLQVVQDSPLLEDILASMTDEEVEFLKERCGCCPNNETLGWFHHCREKDYNNVANLGYSWQAEFRAYHIWKEEVLKQYRYMIWMDSDSMPTKSWDKDPIQYMVDKNAILLYDHFPFGFTNAPLLKEKLLLAYNRTVCYVAETEEGYLKAKDCADRAKISQVGGFMHITDLDFYRSKSALNFNKIVVSYKTPRFSRQWDDQLAVTAPAIMEYPERVYGMHKLGFNASIHHNGFIDGKHKNRIGFGYTKFWAGYGREHWHVGREMCNDLVTENG